ncbi:IMP dehydrogenase, partial [Gammaproteobacteria bacterium]|nr:IMP dehydrogenase [Gammaproteobacteria bacterium]
MGKIKQKAFTFDDVLLLPRFTDFLPAEAKLETKISRNITLKIPLVSAAMDTVTESRMAIALAENGGIGIIHKNNSIEEQAQLVKAVKKYESGVVRDPSTIKSTKTIEELMQLTNELSISGMPVVDDDTLVGIVTSRDFRYADNLEDQVSTIMTPREKLITVDEGTDQAEVKKLMYNNRIEKILVIDGSGSLAGLVTMKDIEKSTEYPFATKDLRGQLRVGAALGTGTDTLARATALAAAGVDLFVVDSAHGHSKNVIDTIKLVKKEFPSIDVMAGNVATPDGAIALRDAGADAI